MITILMPIYNGIEFINESVESIVGQTYEEWELIIGINGHQENSKEYQIAKIYENQNQKITVLDLHFISGKSEALNEMVKHAKYNYIALLDVDDIWNHNKLSIQSEFLHKYDVIGSKCIWFGKTPGIIPEIPVGDISEYDFSLVNPIINSSSIIRKELCYWNEVVLDDYDLWLRIRKMNKKIYNCSEILVLHRIHNDSFYNSKGNHKLVNNLLEKYKEYK
jgi:teichuronic acid biosynthesis glycosyltransferase TuaG